MATKKASTRWEVLTIGPTGRETVHRVDATSPEDATTQVEQLLAHGHSVVEVDRPGHGVGSHPQQIP